MRCFWWRQLNRERRLRSFWQQTPFFQMLSSKLIVINEQLMTQVTTHVWQQHQHQTQRVLHDFHRKEGTWDHRWDSFPRAIHSLMDDRCFQETSERKRETRDRMTAVWGTHSSSLTHHEDWKEENDDEMSPHVNDTLQNKSKEYFKKSLNKRRGCWSTSLTFSSQMRLPVTPDQRLSLLVLEYHFFFQSMMYYWRQFEGLILSSRFSLHDYNEMSGWVTQRIYYVSIPCPFMLIISFTCPRLKSYRVSRDDWIVLQV